MVEEMSRELGVAMSECPVCNTKQKQVQLPDGGVSVEDCHKCWPAASRKPEKASEEQPATAREHGTVTNKEN